MGFLKSLLPWLLPIGIALYVLGVFLERRARRRSWGFKDLVKNPRLWNEMAGGQEQIDDVVEASKRWSDEQIAKALEKYVFKSKTKRGAWPLYKALSGLGEIVHPPVLRLLQDESHRQKLVTPTGNDGLPETPFERACDLLGDTPPHESLEAVRPLLDSDSEEVRKAAALLIGKVGSPDIVQPIRKALNDPEIYVRSHALLGLERAIKGGRLSEECRSDLFDDVCRLLKDDHNAHNAANVLAGFNPARALEVFTSENFFNAANAGYLHYALRAMLNHKISVPRPQLLPLIHEMEKTEDKATVGSTLSG